MILGLLFSGALRCASLLVQDDPWPVAEVSTDDLLTHDCTNEIRRELEYRIEAGMVTADQFRKFLEVCG